MVGGIWIFASRRLVHLFQCSNSMYIPYIYIYIYNPNHKPSNPSSISPNISTQGPGGGGFPGAGRRGWGRCRGRRRCGRGSVRRACGRCR